MIPSPPAVLGAVILPCFVLLILRLCRRPLTLQAIFWRCLAVCRVATIITLWLQFRNVCCRCLIKASVTLGLSCWRCRHCCWPIADTGGRGTAAAATRQGAQPLHAAVLVSCICDMPVD